MRTVLAVGLLVLASAGARAQPCLPLATGNADGNYIVPGARGGVAYRRIHGETLRLDLWTPPRADAPAPRAAGGRVPLVVVIHGGGWTSGSRVAFVGQFLELLATAGYAWASIDYRLGGPAGVADAAEDVEAAVAFTRCHARELDVDPDRLVLLGEDAGAALAARVAVARSPGVVGAVLVGGLYGASAARGTADIPSERPRATHAPGPRFLTIHGTADGDVPIAVAESWCSGMRDIGACDMVRVEGASHRAENWWPGQWGYKARLVEWLRALAPAPAPASPPWPAVDVSRPVAPGLYKRIAYARDTDAPRAPGGSIPSVAAGAPVHVVRTLDAWLPRGQPRPVPAVVLLHGGGWEAGDRVTYVTPLFEPLARAGLAWFSVDYRLTPAVRHPEQLQDVRAAVRFVRRHAAAFGIDPRRLVLVGESASGQMVAMLASEDRTLAGVVSFYGVYDFLPMVTDAAPRSLAQRLFARTILDADTRDTLRRYSPLYLAGSDTVPMLLIHGTNDRLWEQGVAMAARLRDLRVPHELVRLDGAPHGMENWEGHPAWQSYKGRLLSWLRERFARAAP